MEKALAMTSMLGSESFRHQDLDALSEDFNSCVPEQFHRLCVDQLNTALAVHDDHCIRGRLPQIFKLSLACFQGFFGCPAPAHFMLYCASRCHQESQGHLVACDQDCFHLARTALRLKGASGEYALLLPADGRDAFWNGDSDSLVAASVDGR